MFTQILEKTDIAAVDVKDMLTFLNETNTAQKKFVDQLISYSTGQIEGVTGLAIRPTRIRKWMDWREITKTITLSPSPISSLESVSVFDRANVEYPLDLEDIFYTPGDDRIFLPDVLPISTLRTANAIRIEYSAELSPISEDIIMAIQQLVTHHYDNRGITNEVPERIRNLINHPKIARIDAIGG